VFAAPHIPEPEVTDEAQVVAGLLELYVDFAQEGRPPRAVVACLDQFLEHRVERRLHAVAEDCPVGHRQPRDQGHLPQDKVVGLLDDGEFPGPHGARLPSMSVAPATGMD